MGKRCRSQKALADRAQRPQSLIQRQWAQITKEKAAVQAAQNAMATDASKWLELQGMIRRQIKDVRKRSKELEERRGMHQRELDTVMTTTINHHRPRLAHLTRFCSAFERTATFQD
tara:strand:+ start:294 stop:641 length:348 start_codon:yes stop_codon:yes gene_type:complete